MWNLQFSKQGCQNGTLGVQETFGEIFIIENFTSCTFFGLSTKYSRSSGRKTLAGLSKLHSAVHKKVLRKKWWKKHIFFKVFRTSGGKFYKICKKKNREGCRNRFSLAQSINLMIFYEQFISFFLGFLEIKFGTSGKKNYMVVKTILRVQAFKKIISQQ